MSVVQLAQRCDFLPKLPCLIQSQVDDQLQTRWNHLSCQPLFFVENWSQTIRNSNHGIAADDFFRSRRMSENLSIMSQRNILPAFLHRKFHNLHKISHLYTTCIPKSASPNQSMKKKGAFDFQKADQKSPKFQSCFSIHPHLPLKSWVNWNALSWCGQSNPPRYRRHQIERLIQFTTLFPP
jgi:hypothetical protein